jgi:hypothetical protein
MVKPSSAFGPICAAGRSRFRSGPRGRTVIRPSLPPGKLQPRTHCPPLARTVTRERANPNMYYG